MILRGLSIFPTDRSIRPDVLAREAESRGFESLFVCEHTHWPLSPDDPPAYERSDDFARTLDPFVAMTAAAMATEHLRVGTAVSLVAQRDPIHLAKQVASLDVLSNGRVVLGIGAGWNIPEARNHGVAPEDRWAVMGETMKAARAMWQDDVAEFHGKFVDFGPLELLPKPVQTPTPPVLVGGLGPHVLERVVSYGDGWLPFGLPVETLEPQIVELRRLAERAGRPTPTVTIFGAPLDPAVLDDYERIGVERVLFSTPTTNESDALAALDKIAQVFD